jgi:hypothetical protein
MDYNETIEIMTSSNINVCDKNGFTCVTINLEDVCIFVTRKLAKDIKKIGVSKSEFYGMFQNMLYSRLISEGYNQGLKFEEERAQKENKDI